jgi:hypothetical protein
MINKYVNAYFCDVVGWQLMGNHYHLVLRMQAFQELPRCELEERARMLYDSPELYLQTEADWQRFNQRLFDISELERNINGEYARGFNVRNRRRGSLWGGRFKSTVLKDLEAVRECLYYMELNATRAGIVKRPEDYPWGSAILRASGEDDSLVPLTELFDTADSKRALQEYRRNLYQRGAVAAKPNVGKIAQEILRVEEARGFFPCGIYSGRQRCFSDGQFLGSYQGVASEVDRCLEAGLYRRRRYPISQLGGGIFSLREQRSQPRSIAPT